MTLSCPLQVETEAQMAYLHYRLQHCAQDQALLQTAQQLVSQGNSLQQLDMIPKVKPFQVTCLPQHSVFVLLRKFPGWLGTLQLLYTRGVLLQRISMFTCKVLYTRP